MTIDAGVVLQGLLIAVGGALFMQLLLCLKRVDVLGAEYQAIREAIQAMRETFSNKLASKDELSAVRHEMINRNWGKIEGEISLLDDRTSTAEAAVENHEHRIIKLETKMERPRQCAD